MNINSSYTGLQGINDLQSSSLERISSGQAINKASDDASGLIIATNIGVEKSSISQSIENMNSGIAMSNIAQSGISSQKEILENIKTETLKAMNGTMNESDRNKISDRISKYVEEFDSIANSTTYNGTSLLKTDGTPNDDISIVDEDSTIDMEKADTLSVSDTLKAALTNFATDPNSMSNMLKAVDNGMDQLAEYASDYGGASNAMMSSARNSISTEKELASAQSTILDIDYSKEVSDFSKTNIMSQIGYAMQTQANAVTARNISLLS